MSSSSSSSEEAEEEPEEYDWMETLNTKIKNVKEGRRKSEQEKTKTDESNKDKDSGSGGGFDMFAENNDMFSENYSAVSHQFLYIECFLLSISKVNTYLSCYLSYVQTVLGPLVQYYVL